MIRIRRSIPILCGAVALCLCARAQRGTVPYRASEQRADTLGHMAEALQRRLTVSGFVQLQHQWGQSDASLKVGVPNNASGRPFNRFGVRRGYFRAAYRSGIGAGVFQLDVTEKGIVLKDAYLDIKIPWKGTAVLRGGIFERPFGISYSSALRESPERVTVYQSLFPEEREIGAMLTLQAAESSPWHIFKVEGGFFTGNGLRPETDNRRDFIGRLSVAGGRGRFGFSGGGSYYRGHVYQGTPNVYSMRGGEFVADSSPDNPGAFARREYIGLNVRLRFDSPLGPTKLDGEYLWGRQPGGQNNTASPSASTLPATDTYLRDFSGGYLMLAQYLGGGPLAVVGRYDLYDPNTAVRGGQGGTTAADLLRSTVGIGALADLSDGIRLTAYYEFSRNEGKDLKDNVFTLRLQYSF